MAKVKQLSFFNMKRISNSFGGELLKGRRKTARPVSTKHSMHVVVRAHSPIFLKFQKKHRNLLLKLARRFDVKIYEFIFNATHLHLLAKFKSRSQYAAFIRSLTGGSAIVAGVKGAFVFRPFTRIVNWGRDFKKVLSYFRLNEFESDGITKIDGRKLLLILNDAPS